MYTCTWLDSNTWAWICVRSTSWGFSPPTGRVSACADPALCGGRREEGERRGEGKRERWVRGNRRKEPQGRGTMGEREWRLCVYYGRREVYSWLCGSTCILTFEAVLSPWPVLQVCVHLCCDHQIWLAPVKHTQPYFNMNRVKLTHQQVTVGAVCQKSEMVSQKIKEDTHSSAQGRGTHMGCKPRLKHFHKRWMSKEHDIYNVILCHWQLLWILYWNAHITCALTRISTYVRTQCM